MTLMSLLSSTSIGLLLLDLFVVDDDFVVRFRIDFDDSPDSGRNAARHTDTP